MRRGAEGQEAMTEASSVTTTGGAPSSDAFAALHNLVFAAHIFFEAGAFRTFSLSLSARSVDQSNVS